MASILAKRNQTTQVRTAQRTAAIQKAKSDKKENEAKKTKVQFYFSPHRTSAAESTYEGFPASWHDSTQDLKAAGEGRKGRSLVNGSDMPGSSYALSICIFTHDAKYIRLYKRRPFTYSFQAI